MLFISPVFKRTRSNLSKLCIGINLEDYPGRVYRQTFQLTITEAIHRQRVLSAEKMLITDSCSLSEVAERCGFQDVGYFRKVFRKAMGLTPVAWKRRYCKVHINSD